MVTLKTTDGPVFKATDGHIQSNRWSHSKQQMVTFFGPVPQGNGLGNRY